MTMQNPMIGVKTLWYCRRCKVYFTVQIPVCPQHHGMDEIQKIKETK